VKTTQKSNKKQELKQSSKKIDIEYELTTLKKRVKQLEDALDEKDRELREVSISRAEFVQELNEIRNILRTEHLKPGMKDQDKQEISERLQISPKLSSTEIYMKKLKKGDAGKKDKKDKKQKKEGNEHLDASEPDRIDLMGKYSYRERMILMNRIDIYRLFITVIIISSEIKYPRILSKIEEGELKLFINELSEFENMVLDLRTNENALWEKGKTCEKQILQLFTNFFKV
jgi:hypothetical protein